MSGNGAATKENTLQLQPQFSSASSSESEPETEINLIKIGKYITYNDKIQTDFMKAKIMCSYSDNWKLKSNNKLKYKYNNKKKYKYNINIINWHFLHVIMAYFPLCRYI